MTGFYTGSGGSGWPGQGRRHEPADPGDAGDSARLRVGDAERDAVTTQLHEHFAQGRLDREELDERLEVALTARTRADLAPLTADLPAASHEAAGATGVERGWSPGRGRRRRHGHGGALFGAPPRALLAVVLLLVLWRGLFLLLPLLVLAWLVLGITGVARRTPWAGNGRPGRAWGSPRGPARSHWHGAPRWHG